MKLWQYQKLAKYWDSDNDEVTQVALIVCELYGFTYNQVDNMPPKTFLKYSKRVNKMFNGIDRKPLLSFMYLETNAFQITLGQFIEVQHFIKIGEVENMHLISSSLWRDNRQHHIKAEILKNKNVKYILHDFTKFLISFAELLDSYKGLFETEVEIDEDEEEIKSEKPHPFIDQYGWIFSAKQVAEHEGITLDKAFELPVIQAFNALAYLKSFQSYQKAMNK
jgi:hypothetical protein